MKIHGAAASFLLFLYVIYTKISEVFFSSIKKAYFNKPFPMACMFVLSCLKLSAFHWEQMRSGPAFLNLMMELVYILCHGEQYTFRKHI